MSLVEGLLDRVLTKLGNLLTEEVKLQRNLTNKITCLSRELRSMHAALHKVANVPPDQLDEQVKEWARDVRDLSYDAEDILDTFLVRVDRREALDPKPNRFKRVAKKIGKLFNRSKARHHIDGMIEIINQRAEEIASRRARYKLDEIVVKPASTSTIDPRLHALYKGITQLVGIDKPSAELISKLSLQPQQRDDETNMKMKIVSIVGTGGLGKTTLAKAVYDRLTVDFQCTAFVPVGQNPDYKKVFRDILIGLDKKFMDLRFTELDTRQLIDEIREYIDDKRYFIVVDDVWKTETWENIKLALHENYKGSRLITTTRISDVASRAGDEVYNLKPLLPDQSENLFYNRLFGPNGTCHDNQLMAVSEKILNKCHGVPLAIITLASLLVGKTPKEWIEVCSSIFRDKGNPQVSDTEHILSLGYSDLPAHLKTCLLYLSAFPEDYTYYKNSLIWMWVAEGFVQKKQGTGFFEVGEGYFNDLINRSMTMAVESEHDSKVIGCRIHDMMLDLLRDISREENFIRISEKDGFHVEVSPSGRVRRLSHQNRNVEPTNDDRHMDLLGHLRSFVAFSCAYKGLSLPGFKLLRVLALFGCEESGGGFINLEHIESLVHLRYLGLRGPHINELPKGIGALKFLQALDVASASIQELPSCIGQLTQLIYLYAGMVNVPNGVIQQVTSLEELFINCNDSKGQFVQELGKLCELRVLFCNRLREKEVNQSDLVESLGNLHKIQDLTLVGICFIIDGALWDTLELSSNLQHLHLEMMFFPTLPSFIDPLRLSKLSNLVLYVRELDEGHLEILGKFPELRHLRLSTSSYCTLTFRASDGFFQKLRFLSLPQSMVRFVANEDMSVSFTLEPFTLEQGDVAVVGTKPRQDAPFVMPNLEMLKFTIFAAEYCTCGNLGLECIPSLEKVKVTLNDWSVVADDVEKVEAALRQTIEVHPNRPTLQIYKY